jgi:hypothetical protein
VNSKIVVTAIAIIVIVASIIGIHIYLSRPSAPIETPPQITGGTSYIQNDTVDYFIVVGEVKNNLTTAIESVQINATFYDAKNSTIDTSSTYMEESIVPVIQSGQKAPFVIRLVLNPLTTIPDRCDLLLSYIRSSKEAFAEFVISNRTSSLDDNGYYIVSGWVQDIGSGKAVGASVVCTFYDAGGNVIDVSSARLPTWMFSGDKAPFEISSEPRKISPASIELLVVTAAYEPPLPQNIVLLIILMAALIIIVAYLKHRGW